jgi:hypothetical protein
MQMQHRRNNQRMEAEIDNWFATEAEPGLTAEVFWSEAGRWPLLRELAHANFVVQASGAPSERILVVE